MGTIQESSPKVGLLDKPNVFTYMCPKYSPKFILSYLENVSVPLDSMSQMPRIAPLVNNDNLILTEIRKLFNIVTPTNVEDIKKTLRHLVTSHIISKTDILKIEREMNIISGEILNNFLVSESNITLYMQLIGEIHSISTIFTDPITLKQKSSRPIRAFFLVKCHQQTLSFLSEDFVRELAVLDPDDEDDADILHKGKNKVFNMLTTLCYLYDQSDKSGLISINNSQMHEIVDILLEKFTNITVKMNHLGNYHNGNECKDYDEFDLLFGMRLIYAEFIIAIMKMEYKSFVKNTNIIKQKKIILGNQIQIETNLSNAAEIFRTKVISEIQAPHLISRCEDIIKT